MTHSLVGEQDDAVDIHGSDGLGGVHSTAPHFTASKEWISYFDPDSDKFPDDVAKLGFKPSKRKSYLEMLQILQNEPENTVTIIAIGPLTNVAMAAEIDPVTFSRAKEVVSMGGAINEVGNVTPLAEFNVFADALAAARVYALSSPYPSFTLPAESPQSLLKLPDPLKLVLFPVDITNQHVLYESDFDARIKPLLDEASPLAEWVQVFIKSHFRVMESLTEVKQDSPAVELHDPLAVYYGFASDLAGWKLNKDQDVRVETEGIWTKGATIVDKRGRAKSSELSSSDKGAWRYKKAGNKVHVCEKSPLHGTAFGKKLLDTIFDYEEM